VVKVRGQAAKKEGKAPSVTISVAQLVQLRVKGLPPTSQAKIRLVIDGHPAKLGKVITDSAGKATLPEFSLSDPGTYLVSISTGPGTRFVKVVVE